MGLEAAVAFETNKEQRCVRNEKQDGADAGGDSGEIRKTQTAEDCKAVHRPVQQKIKEHGIEQGFRKRWLEFFEHKDHYGREKQGEKKDHGDGQGSEIDIL